MLYCIFRIVSFGENTHRKKVTTQSPIFQMYSKDQDLNTLTNSQMENIVKDIIGSVRSFTRC